MLSSFVGIETWVIIFIGIFFEPFSIPIQDILNILHKQKLAKGRDLAK